MNRLATITIQVTFAIILVSCAIPTHPPPASTPESRPTPEPAQTAPPEALERLRSLGAAAVPQRDPLDLALRLAGLEQPIPAQARAVPWGFEVGDIHEFWVLNWETHTYSRVAARLAHKTPHAYYFVEQSVHLDQARLERLAERFDRQTYPTSRRLFGAEWSPGVDGDPRLVVLFARAIDFSYQNSIDEYSQLVNPYSNEMEIIYIRAGDAALDDDCLLAHEFQHMIRWAIDRDEPVWMNEGLAMLACPLNGYESSGYDDAIQAFTLRPDTQLNTWASGDLESAYAQYGASYLFAAYFWERFGEAGLQALSQAETDGLAGVDQALDSIGAGTSADELFADWIVANYLDDHGLADGRYGYSSLALPAFAIQAEYRAGDPPLEWEASAPQYAGEAIRLHGPGRFQVDFAGDLQVRLAPTTAHSGRYTWWGGRATNGDATLTRSFDLSGLQKATLSFYTWYDIEANHDYAYVEASLDGQRWTTLQGQTTNSNNPTGANYGHGYTGTSCGWVRERLDLSPYAGQQVYIRFEYLTDDGPLGEGFFLDDIEIPELGYRDDAEAGEGGWAASGFTRGALVLPQAWLVQLVTQSGEQTTVERLQLNPENRARRTVELGEGESALLIVSGLTRWTTEQAGYRVVCDHE